MSVEQLRVEFERLGWGFEGPRPDVDDRGRSISALLAKFEAKLGYGLVEDFRDFLTHAFVPDWDRDPKVAVPEGRTAADLHFEDNDLRIYDFMDQSLEWAQESYTAVFMGDMDPGAERQWRTLLVPVSDKLPGSRLVVLDYRYDPVNPPVVRLDLTEMIDAPLFGVDFVAPSFTAMLQQAVPSDLEENPLFGQPCPFADQVLAWRESTMAYLDHHRPLDYRPRHDW